MIENRQDFNDPLTEYGLRYHEIGFRYASRLIIYVTTYNFEDLARETSRGIDELVE